MGKCGRECLTVKGYLAFSVLQCKKCSGCFFLNNQTSSLPNVSFQRLVAENRLNIFLCRFRSYCSAKTQTLRRPPEPLTHPSRLCTSPPKIEPQVQLPLIKLARPSFRCDRSPWSMMEVTCHRLALSRSLPDHHRRHRYKAFRLSRLNYGLLILPCHDIGGHRSLNT
jgi:hypothetical protein